MLEKELELEDDINDVVDIEEDALESAQTVVRGIYVENNI